MSDQSSAELEREAEAVRTRVANTAESIRQKLSAGQLIDEFSDMFTGGDLAARLNNLKSQARENPLPVILVGMGLAWLAFGKGLSGQQGQSLGSNWPASRSAGHEGDLSNDGSLASSIASGAVAAATSVSDGVRHAAETIADKTARAADGLAAGADRLKDGMLGGTTHMPKGVSSAASKIEQEPLLLAAVGLVLGTAVGALLPSTDLEIEQLGPQADRLRNEAKSMLGKGLESASNVASEAYDALKGEADRQGLAPFGEKTTAERVGEVVRSAAQTAQEAARRELGNDGDGRADT